MRFSMACTMISLVLCFRYPVPIHRDWFALRNGGIAPPLLHTSNQPVASSGELQLPWPKPYAKGKDPCPDLTYVSFTLKQDGSFAL